MKPFEGGYNLDSRSLMKPPTAAALLALLLLLSASGLRAADPKPLQLKSLDDLVTVFNQDQGTPRVVLLLSPT